MDLHELQIEVIHNHLAAKAYIHSEERALILKKIVSSASKSFFFQIFSTVKTQRRHSDGPETAPAAHLI